MGVMSKTPGDEPLLPQAKALVDAATAFARRAYLPAASEYPSLGLTKAGGKEHWDLIVSVAAVYIAAARLNNLELGAAREATLMGVVTEHLEAWDAANALACFENCKEFFGKNFEALAARGHEPRFIASDTIGLWLAWNLLERAPQSDDERRFVRGVGVAATHGFFGWWDVKAP